MSCEGVSIIPRVPCGFLRGPSSGQWLSLAQEEGSLGGVCPGPQVLWARVQEPKEHLGESQQRGISVQCWCWGLPKGCVPAHPVLAIVPSTVSRFASWSAPLTGNDSVTVKEGNLALPMLCLLPGDFSRQGTGWVWASLHQALGKAGEIQG